MACWYCWCKFLLSISGWALLILAIWVAIAWIVNKLRSESKASLMIVLGSGGHTAEMLYMLQNYDFGKYKKVYFVLGDNDTMSVNKTKLFMQKNKVKKASKGQNRHEHCRVHRASQASKERRRPCRECQGSAKILVRRNHRNLETEASTCCHVQRTRALSERIRGDVLLDGTAGL